MAGGEDPDSKRKRKRKRKSKGDVQTEESIPKRTRTHDEHTEQNDQKNGKRKRRRHTSNVEQPSGSVVEPEAKEPSEKLGKRRSEKARKKTEKAEKRASEKAEKKASEKAEKTAPENAKKTTSENAEKETFEKAGKEAKQCKRARKSNAGTLVADSKVSRVPQAGSTSRWKLSHRSGGQFVHQDPIFSHDDQYFFAAISKTLNVYSVATSLLVRSLDSGTSTNPVTSYALSQRDPDIIYVGSRDGSIIAWNWVKGLREPRSSIVTRPDLRSIQVQDVEGFDEIIYTYHRGDRPKIYMHRAAEQTGGQWRSTTVLQAPDPLASFQVLAQGKLVVALSSNSLLVAYTENDMSANTFQETSFNILRLRLTEKTTSLAVRTVDKSEEASTSRKTDIYLDVAVGDARGAIFLYEDLFNGLLCAGDQIDTDLSPRKLHWHRHAVGAISWSRDGNYLISGGSELVLVMWQLDTGKKHFLPELTADVESLGVSPSGASYAIRLANNSIIVLSTTELKARAHVAGIQAAAWRPARVACAISPQTPNHLLLAVPTSQTAHNTAWHSDAAFLQTFDLASDCHVDRQTITRSNVTRSTTGPDGQKLRDPNVQLLQLSHDGKWLATLETWAPPYAQHDHLTSQKKERQQAQRLRREDQLKFWQWVESENSWELATVIHSPHPLPPHGMPGHVFDLIANPNGTGFATVGEDSIVRIWRPKTRVRDGLVVTDGKKNPLVVWSSSHSIGLGLAGGTIDIDAEDTDLPVSQTPTNARIAYSPDGSVIAATQQFADAKSTRLVHLIDSQDGTIRRSQPNLYSGPIRALSMTTRHVLILSNDFIVWDLITDTLGYRLDLFRPGLDLNSWIEFSHMTVNPSDGLVALALPANDSKTQILVLKTTDPEPIFTSEVGTVVTALIPVQAASGFIILNSFAEVCILGPSGNAALQILCRPTNPTNIPLDVLSGVRGADDAESQMQIDLPTPDGAVPPQDDTLEVEEDDRPVVVPQKLEEMLDPQPEALLPVKDIFWNVVGLFSKKPRTT